MVKNEPLSRISLTFKEFTDKKKWEEFNCNFHPASFFQSWNWGEVQKKAGVVVERIGIYNDRDLIGVMQLVFVKAKRGNYTHVRGGPVVKVWTKGIIKQITNYLIRISKKSGSWFIRMSPLIHKNRNTEILEELFSAQGYISSPAHNQDAENRWVLDLSGTEDLLFANMRKTTRQLVKKAKNSGIELRKSKTAFDIKAFLKIYKKTATMKKFVAHNLIREEFEIFSKSDMSLVYQALYDGRVLSSAVITFYGDEAIYRHGATSDYGRKMPGSYILQWVAICDAKMRGLKKYNFFGISPDNNVNHPWYGLSQFKKGFGGQREDYIHSLDLQVSMKYWFSYFIDYATKIIKGY